MTEERPLLVPFAALAAGLCSADFWNVSLPAAALAALLGCLVLSSLIRNRWVFLAGTALFFYGWGLHALPHAPNPPLSAAPEAHASRTPVIVEGVVVSRPIITSSGSSFNLRIDRLSDPGAAAAETMIVYVSAGEVTVMRGDRVRLSTRISRPRLLGLPGEFDYPRFLRLQGISVVGRVGTNADVILMRGGEELSFLRTIDHASRYLGDFIRSSLPDPAVSSVLAALLIGDQRRIPPQLAEAYSRAGVSHILSISGFHIGIIVLFVFQVALMLASRWEWLALRVNLRRSLVLATVPFMVLYLLLTGSAPATARSVVMLAIFVLALYLERESDPVDALLLAATVLVAVSPSCLFDLSFQLSFLALWGIVVIVPPLMERVSATGKRRDLIQFTLVSAVACSVTATPVLFTFHQASLNGILSNFVIVPLLGYGAVLLGFMALPFAFVLPPLAEPLLWLAGKLVSLSNGLIHYFSQMPQLRFQQVTRLDMALFLAFMAAVTFIGNRRFRMTVCALLPLGALAVHLLPSRDDGRLHVSMLSVGQAESVLVRFPDRSTMLIDGGGYLHENGRDFGERILAPALFRLGVPRIDRLVMTHSHPDHIGGLPYLAREMRIGEFFEPWYGGAGPLYEQLRSTLAARHVPVRRLAAGDRLSLPCDALLEVLSPAPPLVTGVAPPVDDADLNEGSLVFRLRYRDTSMLFTADAGFAAEQRMLEARVPLAAQVLKVGHHGSRFSTSPAFLARVAPRIALISAGYDNAFGLPAADTLKQLDERRISVYRTDRDGTVDLVSDGTGWSVATPYRTP